jgi:hypothetical protein
MVAQRALPRGRLRAQSRRSATGHRVINAPVSGYKDTSGLAELAMNRTLKVGSIRVWHGTATYRNDNSQIHIFPCLRILGRLHQ